jgi:hypothetical protein
VDLDGWEDLLVATGNGHDVQHADVLAELAQVREALTPSNRLKKLRRFAPLPTPLHAFPKPTQPDLRRSKRCLGV